MLFKQTRRLTLTSDTRFNPGWFYNWGRSENVRPSSLDLSLSDEAYEVEGIFQPQPDETVREVLQQISKKKMDLKASSV